MAFFLFHHSCGRVFLRSHDVALDFLARVGGLYFAKNAKTLARLSVRHSSGFPFGHSLFSFIFPCQLDGSGATHPFFFVSSLIACDLTRSWQYTHIARFLATTDPPQATAKLWLPPRKNV